jgi:MFS family permease
VALGLPGIALAIVVRLTLREPPRGFFDAVKDDTTSLSFGETINVLWHCRTYRLLMLFLVVNGFVQYGLNQWWPSFYTRIFGLSLSTVGVYVGAAIGVGSGLGLLIGGLLANKAAQYNVKLPLLMGAAATALALPAALGSLFISSASGSIFLVAVTALFWSVSNGPVVATVYSVVTSRMRATAGAITIFATSVLGFGLGPFCVGLLSDKLTPSLGMEALRYALLAPICLLPLMVIALCAAAGKLPADLKAATAQL